MWVLHGLSPCALRTRDLPCHFFSPSPLSPPGLTYSYGKDPGGTRFPSQPQALARGGRGADARSPPAPLSPAGFPAAPTCFALNGAGGAGGLFRPRLRAVAGGGLGRRALYGRGRLTWAGARSAFFGHRRAGAAPGPTPKYGDGRGRIPGGRSLPPPAVIKGSAAAAAATSDPARSGSLSLCPTRSPQPAQVSPGPAAGARGCRPAVRLSPGALCPRRHNRDHV